MKKIILKKSQLSNILIKESDEQIPKLLKENTYEELMDNVQQGDIIYLDRINKANRKFKIIEVKREGNIYLFDIDKKFHAEIDSWDEENGEFTITNIGKPTDTGKIKKQRTTITLGNIRSLLLVRDNNNVIVKVESGIKDIGGEDDPITKKSSKKIIERQEELRKKLSEADVGDIIRLIKGDIDDPEDEEIINETVINLRVDDRRASGTYILSLDGSEGHEEDKFNNLGQYDKIIVNKNSIQIKDNNVNTFDFIIGTEQDGERGKLPLQDLLILDVIKKGEEDEEKKDEEEYDTAYDEAKDKLSDEQFKKLKNDPLYNQALRTSMEIDDILKKLGPKKGLKGKDRKEWRDKEKYEIRWESRTLGDDGYKLKKEKSYIGTYRVNENMLTWKLSKAKNEHIDSDVIYELNNIRSTEGNDMYKADVRIYTYDKDMDIKVRDETGVFRKIKSGVKG